MPLAQEPDLQNRERQKIERAISDEVMGIVRSKFDPHNDYVIVEGQLLWHIGVVGIVASRVLQQFYRPTFIIGGEGDAWRGSGRSIAGFDLAAALRECDDLLLRHGGHAMAAGVTIHPDKIDTFRLRLNEIARRSLKYEHLKPPLRLDAEVGLDGLSLDSLAELDRLRPKAGQSGRPVLRPQFVLFRWLPAHGGGKTASQTVGQAGRGDSRSGLVERRRAAAAEGAFDLAYAPSVNEFNGRRGVRLKILDWRPARRPA